MDRGKCHVVCSDLRFLGLDSEFRVHRLPGLRVSLTLKALFPVKSERICHTSGNSKGCATVKLNDAVRCISG